MLTFDINHLQKPWGGKHLAKMFSGQDLGDAVGEVWLLSDIPEFSSTCLENGKSLGTLWRSGQLGGSAKGKFPLLLKWLSTSSTLSVQVHPNKEAVRKLGAGASKTEAWWIAAAAADSFLLLGHKKTLTSDNLEALALSGEISQHLHCIKPQAGEAYHVIAGTIHAVGPSLLLLEIQEPSDTTFRLYDWGRKYVTGQMRELHLLEAAQCIDFKDTTLISPTSSITLPIAKMKKQNVGDYFKVEPQALRIVVAHEGDFEISFSSTSQKSRTSALPIGQDSVEVRQRTRLSFGEVAVLEPHEYDIQLEIGTCVLITEA